MKRHLKLSAIAVLVFGICSGMAHGQVVQGTGATGADSTSTAIGTGANAGSASTAVGNTAKAQDGSTAVGNGAVAGNTATSQGSATAIGPNASATGTNSFAGGYKATDNGNSDSVVIGDQAKISGGQPAGTGGYAVSIGSLSSASYDGIALGAYSTSLNSGDAIGYQSSATGASSVALGGEANASGFFGIAAGTGSVASGGSASAFGAGATASGNNSSVLGSFATASGDNSTAIGFNARATNANDVALGANTTANGPDATANYTTPNSVVNGYAFTVQQAASGAVAVGNRQITQVADGEISATSLDAVNGSQVFKITQAIESQISGLGSSPASPPNNSAPTTVITEANPYLAVNSKGPQATATGTNAVAVGSAAVAAGNNSVALGSGSIATRDDSVSVGAPGAERQITNVAAGTQATDAVNVQQLNSAVGGLQQGMNSIARNAYSGIAAAAALAAIPDVDAGKTIAVGVGTGNYQGYQAWSLGATARLAENIKMRAGVSQSSGGTTWNLGAAMEW